MNFSRGKSNQGNRINLQYKYNFCVCFNHKYFSTLKLAPRYSLLLSDVCDPRCACRVCVGLSVMGFLTLETLEVVGH